MLVALDSDRHDSRLLQERDHAIRTDICILAMCRESFPADQTIATRRTPHHQHGPPTIVGSPIICDTFLGDATGDPDVTARSVSGVSFAASAPVSIEGSSSGEPNDMDDVVVIGGGVIGLSIAYELAEQGASVCVLERGAFGREASWAGAGILPPGNPECAVETKSRLRAESHVLWPALSRQLRETTGIDNGYLVSGGLHVRIKGAAGQLSSEIADWRSEGVSVQELNAERAFAYEPALSSSLVTAYRLPELGQVRNPRHLKALQLACSAQGVRLLPGMPVVGFDVTRDRVVSLQTPNGAVSANRYCVAGGAWTRELLNDVGLNVEVHPVRGQIVQLSMMPLPFRHVIGCGPRYLVARPDGRILIGSTEERAGFNKANTADGVSGLIDFAVSLVPALAAARFERAWSGLRPGSPDGLPYVGAVSGFDNLFVAAGHFRSGLQMSPGTARLMRQLILEQQPFMDPTGLSPARDPQRLLPTH